MIRPPVLQYLLVLKGKKEKEKELIFPEGEGEKREARDSGMNQETHVIFEQFNSWTYLVHVHPFMLYQLEHELRYPTPVAYALEAGFVPPDEDGELPTWDGWIRMLRINKTEPPKAPTGLLPMMLRLCWKFGFTSEVRDRRQRPEEDVPDGAQVELRDYQLQAVERALDAGRGVLDMPPRSGKTRTMVEIHRRLAQPTLWIAPTDRIVDQTHGVLEEHFGPNYSRHLVGAGNAMAAARLRVVVCTAATAGLLPAEFFASRQVVVVDEWHHGAAKTYRRIFGHCDHVYYRFGMTGTFFRSGDDAMAMHALLSNTVYKITSRELLARGQLVPTNVVFVPVPGPKLRGVEGGYQVGHGKHGVQEHDLRNRLVAGATSLLCGMGRRVLVLVDTKKQGQIIRDMVGQLLPRAPDGAQFRAVENVDADRPRPAQKAILESFVAGQEVRVLIGTSLIGEGVDLPAADALVYAKGKKAEVELVQNAYRVCTAIEGKRDAVIVDFADRHHRKLLEHCRERLAIYYGDPVFNVSVLQDPNDFPAWVKSLSAFSLE